MVSVDHNKRSENSSKKQQCFGSPYTLTSLVLERVRKELKIPV